MTTLLGFDKYNLERDVDKIRQNDHTNKTNNSHIFFGVAKARKILSSDNANMSVSIIVMLFIVTPFFGVSSGFTLFVVAFFVATLTMVMIYEKTANSRNYSKEVIS